MADSTPLKAAQMAAILAAAFGSGGIIGLSLFPLPAFALKSTAPQNRVAVSMGAPVSHVARQWQYCYDLGKKLYPSIAISSSLMYSYVSYTLSKTSVPGSRASKLFAAAAGLNVLIAPFTVLLMVPVNKAIQKFTTGDHDLPAGADPSTEEYKQSAKAERKLADLLEQWSLLNTIRGLFPLAGAGLGAAVTLGLLS